MGELWFVGLGLSDERGLSREASELLARASAIFAETYTSVLPDGTLDRIGQAAGRPVRTLDRAELEAEGPTHDALARGSPVVLLVPGDPFAATTHVALRISVASRGHAWRYLPNASILTAAPGLLGLIAYRFGRVASLPFPEPGFAPTSPLDVIRQNRSIGAHTLVLLDLRPSEGRYLRADEAIRILRARDPDGTVVPDDRSLAVVARVGRPEAAAWFGPVPELLGLDFGPPPHALVVPAPTLHFEEAAALERIRIGRTPGPGPLDRPAPLGDAREA